MPALPVDFDPYDPIPNGPFYSPLTYYLQGPVGPLVVGSGLSVSLQGVISSSGGGGGGTVTSITAGAGLAGGTITSTGTISLAATGVAAGAYVYPALSVDSYGRVTSISSGSPVQVITVNSPLQNTGSSTAPILSIQPATTSTVGAVQLNNTTSSTLTNQALTAAAGKSLQDQINAVAQNANGLILAGTLNASTGNVVNATTAGTSAGFTAGSPVPAAAPAINDYYVIVTTAAASYTPTGGAAISNVNVGDYILCSGGVWTILRVGPITGAYATTTTAGVVELATAAEAIAGTDPNLVLTPFTGASAYVARNLVTAKGQVLVASGPSTVVALGIGIDGQVLTANSAAPYGVAWAAGGGGGGGGITSISFTAPLNSTANPLTAGAAAVGINAASTTACGAVQLATPSDALTGLSTTLAITPAAGAAAYLAAACFNVKGDLIVGTANDTYAVLPAGGDGLALVACAACTTGLTWASALQPSNPSTLGASYGIACDALSNTSVGFQALQAIYQVPGTGQANTALGRGAAGNVTSGCGNVALGAGALSTEAAGNYNTALGSGALASQNGGEGNIAIGFCAGRTISTGDYNVLIGYCAGDTITAGTCNIGIGTDVLGSGTITGIDNIALGTGSSAALTGGCFNIALGCGSASGLTSGCNNILVGCAAGANITTQSDQIVFGTGGSCTTATATGGVTFQFGSTCSLYAVANGTATWTAASDERLKEDIQDLALGLDFVNKIQPRSFVWKSSQHKSAGFIAQELDAVVTESDADYLGLVNKDNDIMGVGPTALIPVLVNAIKELKAEVEELKAKLG